MLISSEHQVQGAEVSPVSVSLMGPYFRKIRIVVNGVNMTKFVVVFIFVNTFSVIKC